MKGARLPPNGYFRECSSKRNSIGSVWDSERMSTEFSLISSNWILILPLGVVTSENSPDAIVRLLINARRWLEVPERPLSWKEAAEMAGAFVVAVATTAVREESGKKGSLTGELVMSKTARGIRASCDGALVPVAAGASASTGVTPRPVAS